MAYQPPSILRRLSRRQERRRHQPGPDFCRRRSMIFGCTVLASLQEPRQRMGQRRADGKVRVRDNFQARQRGVKKFCAGRSPPPSQASSGAALKFSTGRSASRSERHPRRRGTTPGLAGLESVIRKNFIRNQGGLVLLEQHSVQKSQFTRFDIRSGGIVGVHHHDRPRPGLPDHFRYSRVQVPSAARS